MYWQPLVPLEAPKKDNFLVTSIAPSKTKFHHQIIRSYIMYQKHVPSPQFPPNTSGLTVCVFSGIPNCDGSNQVEGVERNMLQNMGSLMARSLKSLVPGDRTFILRLSMNRKRCFLWWSDAIEVSTYAAAVVGFDRREQWGGG